MKLIAVFSLVCLPTLLTSQEKMHADVEITCDERDSPMVLLPKRLMTSPEKPYVIQHAFVTVRKIVSMYASCKAWVSSFSVDSWEDETRCIHVAHEVGMRNVTYTEAFRLFFGNSALPLSHISCGPRRVMEIVEIEKDPLRDRYRLICPMRSDKCAYSLARDRSRP